jgi:hypothetical protein
VPTKGDPAAQEAQWARLDADFVAANGAQDLLNLTGRWIAGWSYLRVVDAADRGAAISDMAAEVPFGLTRTTLRDIDRIGGAVKNILDLAVGLAVLRSNESDVLLSVGGGASLNDEAGLRGVFHVTTRLGPRMAVCEGSLVTLFDYVESGGTTRMGSPLDRHLGAQLRGKATMEEGIALANAGMGRLAPAAICFLLQDHFGVCRFKGLAPARPHDNPNRDPFAVEVQVASGDHVICQLNDKRAHLVVNGESARIELNADVLRRFEALKRLAD